MNIIIRKRQIIMIEPVNTIEYNEPIFFAVDSENGGKRLDKLLSEFLSEYSRSFVQNLFSDGLVECNGKGVSKSHKPKCGDIISFTKEINGLTYVEQELDEGGVQKLFYGEYNTSAEDAEYEWVLHSIRNGNKTTLSSVMNIAKDYEANLILFLNDETFN